MLTRILSSQSSLFGTMTQRIAHLFLVLFVFHEDYFGGVVFLNTATGLAVGTDHACVLLDNGSIKCFGTNGYGQLGYGDTVARGKDSSTMGDNLNAVDLGSDVSTVVSMSAGIAHTCVIFDEGVLKCFGRNNKGQLGLGDNNHRGDEEDEMGDFLPAVPLGTNRTAVAVVAEGYRTCVLLDNGKVRCWGDGEFGALGSGDEVNTGNGDEIADSVDLGENTAVSAIGRGPCAIFEDGSLSCWGKGYYGQNGQGTMDNVGDDEGEMGAALGTVPLGSENLVRAVEAGRDYSCALLRSGDWGMKCWGRGEGGQLGSEGIATVGDDPDEMGDMLPLVDLGTKAKVVEVAAGEQHTCAVLSSGAVKCWGRSFYGNLGLEDIRARGHKPDTMGSALPEVDLGADRTAVSIGAGGERTCAILDNGELKCWGGNADGQLGLGDTQARGLAEGQMGDQLPPVALGTNRTAVALFANVWTLPPTPAPTSIPTPQPTPLPTPQPTPLPTPQPTLEPTPQPTSSPTLQPTPSPTLRPTLEPTPQPTSSPTPSPTFWPTLEPTSSPTLQPTSSPTLQPTSSPTSPPTLIPTFQPTSSPTLVPTLQPTSSPTLIPALQVMTMPTTTSMPTSEIEQHASEGPSVAPTAGPSSALSAAPTSIATRIAEAPFEGILPTQNPTSASVSADRGTSSVLNSTETTVLVSLLAPLGVLFLLGGVILFRRRNRFLAAAVASLAEGVDEDAIGTLSLHGASNSVGKRTQSRIV